LNIIKVREDKGPIKFEKDEEKEGFFKVKEGTNTYINDDGSFSELDLRSRVEPWLSSLFQSEHLSLLLGSGLSTAIQIEATGKANNGMNELDLSETKYKDKIKTFATESAKKTGRGISNIEDEIRIANELLRGLKISGLEEDDTKKLEELINKNLQVFTANISTIENSIATAELDKREKAFQLLVSFLMSFASRTGTRDRLHIFTTNYDRLIEEGADIAGLHLIDRFVGSLNPIFRSSRLDIDMHYNPPGIRGEPRYLEGVAKYTKLHGSIDWVETDTNNIRKIGMPFGAKTLAPFLEAANVPENYQKVLIYPNSSKDRETSEYPYVELFRDFAAALCRPNSTLVVYGYSFGDDHINRIISDMLTIPSTHLVIIAYNDEGGRAKKFYDDCGHTDQITLFIGEDIANIKALTNLYLPKSAIDKNSIKMAELIKARIPTKEETAGEKGRE
jgi:hypothetical protein